MINKIIRNLVNSGKLSPRGLPHFGGKQYQYRDKKDKFIGNINLEKLGELVYDLTDEELNKIINEKTT